MYLLQLATILVLFSYSHDVDAVSIGASGEYFTKRHEKRDGIDLETRRRIKFKSEILKLKIQEILNEQLHK